MNRDWYLMERCCGSAALTIHLLGGKRAILPYQGSKWRHRQALTALIREAGFVGAPSAVRLIDSGPWGHVAPLLLDFAVRFQVADILESFPTDPRDAFDEMNEALVPAFDLGFAAQFLFLQRLSFSGKAVGIHDGRWVSPGFNQTSAYGVPATDRFGEVKPMIPALVQTLRGYKFECPHLDCFAFDRAPRKLVYIDPPYRRGTGYPNGTMRRGEVMEQARYYLGLGAKVMVSETEPIDALVAEGWRAVNLQDVKVDCSPFRGKQPEWVTLSPGWRAA